MHLATSSSLVLAMAWCLRGSKPSPKRILNYCLLVILGWLIYMVNFLSVPHTRDFMALPWGEIGGVFCGFKVCNMFYVSLPNINIFLYSVWCHVGPCYDGTWMLILDCVVICWSLTNVILSTRQTCELSTTLVAMNELCMSIVINLEIYVILTTLKCVYGYICYINNT